ncbi:uncharacterized protein BDZ99DRAFT_468783 [Mytilinidion resinicola]|uniref:Uncharacterized protein n=1 Tax=Mytilinidion resinicola TaxID=574789 RepID=A0A6A6Y4Y2_9PEZI|nr:uncharacterized protein BDZ99DRAFT_468783 [Mytilinidion resinicola]KAF2802847.1 hypothetical protein BDZ99DRAFT_468783 [Mytilinidion resinicola]
MLSLLPLRLLSPLCLLLLRLLSSLRLLLLRLLSSLCLPLLSVSRDIPLCRQRNVYSTPLPLIQPTEDHRVKYPKACNNGCRYACPIVMIFEVAHDVEERADDGFDYPFR